MLRPSSRAPEPDSAAREIAALERRLAHAGPGSPRAAALEEEIERLRGDQDERPGADEPEMFARILAEMRIPAGQSVSGYEPGYRARELEKAMTRPGLMRAASLPWVERGPGNVAGRARGIVVDPDDPDHDTWFIASVGGGVWKTTDAGANWQWMTPDFPVLATQCIAMAPSDHDVLYVGTGESYYNIDTMNGDGMFKSVDRGLTWTHIPSTAGNPAFESVARIVVHPDSANVLLVCATRGRFKEYLNPRSSIFKSHDGGTTWTEVYASTVISGGRVEKIQQLLTRPAGWDTVYAAVDEGGILRSINGGDTWAFSNTGITDFTGRFELAVAPSNHNRIYAAAEGASHAELYVSTDGGTSWTKTTEAGPEPNWLGGQGWYDNTLIVHPTDPNTVFLGGVALWKTTVTGSSRSTSYLAAPVHSDNHGLRVINAPGGWRLLNTSDGGVAVSTSQDTGWNQPTDGMVTTQFYGIDKRPGASAYVGGTQDNGTWLSPNDPAANTPWDHVIGGDGYETSWNFDDPLLVIGGYQYNGLQRSTDGGITWTAANVSVSPPGLIENGAGNAPFITKIGKTNLDPNLLFAVGKSGVWRSTDFGATWSLTPIAMSTWGVLSSFHDVRVSRADPDVVWAGSGMYAGVHMQVSTNGGLTFNPSTNYTTFNMGGISGLATHPTDPNTAYVLFSFAQLPKILRTTDGGANWEDITGFEADTVSTNGFPDVAVYDLLVFSDDTDHIWAATEIGIVESLDNGVSWALAANGLPNVGIWFLTEVEDEIVAGTHGRGVWSVTIPSLIAGKTFKPLIEGLTQGLGGSLDVDINLRSVYDSSHVYVDSVLAAVVPANTLRQEEVVSVPILTAGTREVYVTGYKDGTPYPSVLKQVNVFEPKPAVFAYENDFETPDDDFLEAGLTRTTTAGFPGTAIHSAHNYPDASTLTCTLTVPIRVAWENALLSFDEVAMVEPGDPGSVYGDDGFYDYVIVEGTRNGVDWVPLAPGYDTREYPEWENLFNTSTAPDSTNLKHRVVDLRDTFQWNDTILIRFRLFADAYVNGWGWIIDNLEIQVGSQTGIGDGPAGLALALDQNVPNPVASATSIRFVLPEPGPASLEVFDVQGRLVRSLLLGDQAAGEHFVHWDGRNQSGYQAGSGVYFYRLYAGGEQLKRKMIVLP